ncbi:MAG: RNA polymerase sigma factor [Planctomycetota bacterium]|jgi:RNA polymerase sigma-70 factor (ECF subfamily)
MAETNAKSLGGPVHNSPIDDELLVRQFNNGDDSAFEAIVQKHSADIAALANRLLAWPGDVDDVVQDIFLAALLGLKKFRGECSLKTWLFTITINECRNYRYRQALRLKFFSKASGKETPSSADPPDKSAMNADTFDRIRRAIKALPAKYREPLVLKYLQQLSTNEIAEILGTSQNTLQVRLTRARKRLKKDLTGLIEG